MTPEQAIRDWAKRRGFRIAFAGIGLLDSVRERIEGFGARGDFAPGFAEENLNVFRYLDDTRIKDPRAILLAVIPAPAWILRFEHPAGSVEAILPPTYVRYRPLFEETRLELLNDVLAGNAGIETLQAPLKSLAVGVGLASYGRNNIAYAPEYGSYFQIAGYILDFPVEGAVRDARFDRRLDLCAACKACVRACSRGAIAEDRFLIRADRCFTLFSESESPFPEDVRPPSPDCLIGCLRCQEVCPANRGLLSRRRTPVSFTEEETAALLSAGAIEDARLRERIDSKFKTLALTEGVPVLRRNLRLLFGRRAVHY